jgi:hypothetical protein
MLPEKPPGTAAIGFANQNPATAMVARVSPAIRFLIVPIMSLFLLNYL